MLPAGCQTVPFWKTVLVSKSLGIFVGYNSRSGITGPQGIFLGIYQSEITAYFHKRHILECFKSAKSGNYTYAHHGHTMEVNYTIFTE